MRRRVGTHISSKHKHITINTIERERPTDVMRQYGLSEVGYQQVINNHMADCTQSEKLKEIKKIYDGK